MTAILLALGSSIGYGVTDFLGGLAARRMPVLLLGAITQPLGILPIDSAMAVSPAAMTAIETAKPLRGADERSRRAPTTGPPIAAEAVSEATR